MLWAALPRWRVSPGRIDLPIRKLASCKPNIYLKMYLKYSFLKFWILRSVRIIEAPEGGCIVFCCDGGQGGGGGGGWISNFSKRGDLTGPQLLEGCCWERGEWLFSGGWLCNFHIKNKLKSQIFNDKKSL